MTQRRNADGQPLPTSQAGFSLVAVLAAITVMLILMSVGVPTWQYVMKDAREEELIFRGGQIADAVGRYQKKNGNAAPPSLEVLVKGRYLRKAYKDPMTKDGRWRFIHAGEQNVVPGLTPGGGPPGVQPNAPPRPTGGPGKGGEGTGDTGGGPPSAGPGTTGGPGTAGPGGVGITVGAFIGVASLSTETSLRIFNGRTKYNQWLFVAGQPRVVGKLATGPPQPVPPGGPGGGPPPATQPPSH